MSRHLNLVHTSYNIPLFQMLYVSCIALLSYFPKFSAKLIITLISLQFHALLCHLMLGCTTSRGAVRDLRLYRLNVCQAISSKAVLFDVTLFKLIEYYAISSEADSFDLTLNCFLDSVPFHVRCLAIPSYPASIISMFCHSMHRYPI